MKAIHLKETDLVAIILPTDLKSYKLTDNGTILMWQLNDGKEYFSELMCKHLELGTCTKDHIDFDVEHYQHWRDTNNTPEQSFRSLLTANGILFEPPQYCGCSGPCGIPCSYADWDDAGRPLTPKVLILKKLK